MEITEILIKIRRIVRSINLESKKVQKEYGVSIPQILCLGHLNSCPGFQSTQGEIRKFLNLNSSTVSGIINRLENKGLLARLPKSGDKRVVNIVLTSSGDRLFKRIPALMHDQLTEKLEALSISELKTIEKSLDTLVDLLNIKELDASPLIAMDDPFDENGIREDELKI